MSSAELEIARDLLSVVGQNNGTQYDAATLASMIRAGRVGVDRGHHYMTKTGFQVFADQTGYPYKTPQIRQRMLGLGVCKV